MKLWAWDKSTAKKIISQRLRQSEDSRKDREARWSYSEAIAYDVAGGTSNLNGISISTPVDGESLGQDDSASTNYVMKNVRFMHAQMSANPPSTAARPSSSDPEDRKAAKAADKIVRGALRTYKMHERSDERNLNTIIYGTGFVKIRWNPALGELLEVSEETGEFVTEGDIEICIPNIWNIYLDADATNWDSVRYVFEKIQVPWEEAVSRWPEHVDILKKHRIQESVENDGISIMGRTRKPLYDVVTLYEYWEKGMPINGYVGRFALHTKDGDILELSENPERYRPISATYADYQRRKKEKTLPLARAFLPYISLTDIDEPGSPWGLSTVEFAAPMQENLNRLDYSILSAARAHGMPRLILTEGCELRDESLSTDTWDVVKVTGNQPPSFMEPMPLPAAAINLRESYKMGIDDMQGINESMFGQQSREQSGFSMQYATNQGNMIRQRLFNKYLGVTEDLHRRFLVIAANRWSMSKTVQVVGKENNLDTNSFKGSDIMHGYDVVVEFGASLSLDPMTRRGELMNMMPLLKEANVDPGTILSMARLGETDTVLDMVELANNRMQDYFDEIISTQAPVPPRKNEDHQRMLIYAGQFVMMRAYQDLPEFLKDLIDGHIEERQKLVAAPPPPAGLEVPGAPSAPGAGPAGEGPVSLGDIPPEILNV